MLNEPTYEKLLTLGLTAMAVTWCCRSRCVAEQHRFRHRLIDAKRTRPVSPAIVLPVSL
jgi:hypothetical protein